MPKRADAESRERVLDAADSLFATRGFADVTLRDIAAAANMHHSSLYYYAPGGKEQLYLDVMERNLQRHYQGIVTAIEQAGGDLRAQLTAVARWLMSQPLLDFTRMSHSDVRSVAPQHSVTLLQGAHKLHQPVVRLLADAIERGEIRFRNVDMAAYAFVAMIESMNAVPADQFWMSREDSIHDMVELFLTGIHGAP